MRRFWSRVVVVSLVLFAFSAGPLTAAALPVYVTFWFDTEDFILPEADDAAMRLAEMFTARGVQATFKIVGEKARVLEERETRGCCDRGAWRRTTSPTIPRTTAYTRRRRNTAGI